MSPRSIGLHSDPVNRADCEVRVWSEADWLASAAEHEGLLAASDADPLFNSWLWQTLWWRIYGARVGRELCVLAVYRSGRLIGLAPFYFRREWRHRIIPVNSVQRVGMCWRDSGTLISEYLDIVAIKDCYEQVRELCLDKVQELYPYSEFIIATTRQPQRWLEALSVRAQSGGYVRSMDPSVSYQAILSGGFEEYLLRLSPSARRAVRHMRRRLEGLGEVQLSAVPPDEVGRALQELNGLHATRWGSHAFEGDRLDFHLQFAARIGASGGLRMSRLTVGGRTVSVLYDVRIGECQYNLQLGFDEAFERGVSLGLLHMGYAMERAASEGVQVYDFLAGPGKHTDYKRRLGQQSCDLGTVQYLRDRSLARLYRWHDKRGTRS